MSSRRTAAALAALVLIAVPIAACSTGDGAIGGTSHNRSMMGGNSQSWSSGMMGGTPQSWAPAMMGGYYWLPGDGVPVSTLAQARAHADAFARRFGLRVGEVMQFSRNFYAELRTPAGKPATEILVDPADGDTGIEYGPAMMWNTEYGMHHRGAIPARFTPAQARARARQWLRDRSSDLTVGEAEAYPGYYTLHTLRSGKIDGMLSVNASSGAVWDHTWHGRYIATG
ncbi:hypothetical protein [Streptomyces cylindrosporus]|uniref:Peptidase M4 n=1 Tax=Streptomyces cylindrosporus TaxID=2927583 RepID=A0ABS9YLX7_9ACTN|nr:hypothetical protein [Streptomyces cylindrosporus]MCI3278160.1 hypothetical protein [Streptomyces cylindrosporus]